MLAIIDIGIGNLRSVVNAFRYVGADPTVVTDPRLLDCASKIVLPGVGSFKYAMETLHSTGFGLAITRNVKERKVPMLGICLGMQLLANYSTEDGATNGLGLIDCIVERFSLNQLKTGLKVPHVGFDSVEISEGSLLFSGFPRTADFYFTHSYRMQSAEHDAVAGICRYGEAFVAAVEKDNIFGTQFHPEKSQSNGLKLFRNFVEQI